MKKLWFKATQSSKDKPRIKLINKRVLVMLTLAASLSLWLVAPTKAILFKFITASTSPDISFSFLKILSDREPENRELQILVADNYRQRGNVREALAIVEPLLSYPDHSKDWHAYSVYLDALLQGHYTDEFALQAQSTAKLEALLNAVDAIPKPDIARKFADAALSLGRPWQAFKLLEPYLNSHQTNSEELLSLALQTSDYDSAIRLLSNTEMVASSDKPGQSEEQQPQAIAQQEKLSLLHQIYRWQGETQKAFEISLLITASEPTEVALREALAEAKALGDIYYEALFYNQLAKRNSIEPSEYTDWLNAVEKGLGTQTAILKINELRRKRPNDTALLAALSRLYTYTSDHLQVVKQYEQLKQYRASTFAEAERFANAYIMLAQPQRALAVLTAVNSWPEADVSYLQTVFSLAWLVSDKATALASQRALIARSNAHLDVYRYIQLRSPFTKSDIADLVKLCEQSANSDLLLHAIRITHELGDSNKMQTLIGLARKNASIKDSAELSYYRALLAVHHNQGEAARGHFRKSLSTDKTYLPAIGSYLWWAIARQDKKTMRELYAAYQVSLSGERELWPAFAAAAQQLGDYRQAQYWYEKQLMANPNPDVAVLIHYASLLEKLGEKQQAYGLREYVAQHLSAQLLALPDGGITLRALVALMAGDVVALELMDWDKIANSQTSANHMEEFTRYQLALGQSESIKFWHQRTLLASYKLPQWQALAIAIQQHDQATMERLLSESISLPLADQYYALQATGHDQLAWQKGQQQIGRLTDKDAEKQLLASHVKQHPDKSHSIRNQYTRHSQWGMDTYSLDYYAPLNSANWQLGTDIQRADSPDVFTRRTINNELRLRGHYQYLGNAHKWGVGFDFADGLGDKRLGVHLSYATAIDNYWALAFKLGLNNDTRMSQMLAIAGSNNLVDVNLHYQPSARNSLALQATYHDLSTRFDDYIGTSWELAVRASEQIFFADPAWQVYGQYHLQRASFNDQPLDGINRWNQGANLLTGADFLDQRYERISFGQRFSHGQPGSVGATSPSPRYWFDSSVGYNLINSQADITLSAGVGWRLIGNDELFFSVDWQSQDRQGDSVSTLSLGYSYGF